MSLIPKYVLGKDGSYVFKEPQYFKNKMHKGFHGDKKNFNTFFGLYNRGLGCFEVDVKLPVSAFLEKYQENFRDPNSDWVQHCGLLSPRVYRKATVQHLKHLFKLGKYVEIGTFTSEIPQIIDGRVFVKMKVNGSLFGEEDGNMWCLDVLWCTNCKFCVLCKKCDGCTNCKNCSDCKNCVDCDATSDSTDCTNTNRSEHCTNCTNCDDCMHATSCTNGDNYRNSSECHNSKDCIRCNRCKNCRNCTNCNDCTDCLSCEDSNFCNGCHVCNNCTNCNNCVGSEGRQDCNDVDDCGEYEGYDYENEPSSQESWFGNEELPSISAH